jgi:hypothetical protein
MAHAHPSNSPALRLLTPALLACLLGAAAPVHAEGIDRDPLLAEAPAVPDKGTVRVSGAAYGQGSDASNTGGITASIQWTPIDRLAGDVGLYLQGQGAGVNADNGPQARLRFQLLKQRDAGLDLSLGVRFKKIGFYKSPNDGEPDGEVELLLLGGRRFGPLDLIVNYVYGSEIGGPGKDMEGKAFVGFSATEALRLGVDGRLQAEYKDENGYKTPHGADMDFILGPAASLLLMQNKLQLQLLLGASKPKGIEWSSTTVGGLLAASYDL